MSGDDGRRRSASDFEVDRVGKSRGGKITGEFAVVFVRNGEFAAFSGSTQREKNGFDGVRAQRHRGGRESRLGGGFKVVRAPLDEVGFGRLSGGEFL